MNYEAIIGLECHAQLATASKLFCNCPIVDADASPNTAVCPVCLGHPGTLPALNDQAVALAIKAGVATGCTVHKTSVFSRKQYFYPDLSKGYQISQFDLPIATKGTVHVEVNGEMRAIGITRIHMEEDAGKSMHSAQGTRVDYNRAGTGLVEIVSEADLRSAEESEAYLRMLHRVLVELGICHGDMEKGHFRCDANVSVHKPGTEWGTRVEIKNVNSFRFVAKAIDYEIKRQIEVLEAGGTIHLETRTWRGNETAVLRSKEDASDYRYFPEPDLPPLELSEDEILATKNALPGVPMDLWLHEQDQLAKGAFKERYSLDDYLSNVLLNSGPALPFFEASVAAGGDSRKMANWVQGEVMRILNEGENLEDGKLTPSALAELQGLIDDGTISHNVGKKVFSILWDEGGAPKTVVEKQGLSTVSDEALIRQILRDAISGNPKQLSKYQSGNERMIGFFIGQVMQGTQGRAEPQLTRKLAKEELDQA